MIRFSILLVTGLATSALQAQSAFVAIVNGDTAFIERFTHASARLEGEVVIKGQPRQVYAYDIDAAGRLGPLSLSVYSPGAKPDAAAMQQVQLAVIGDSAIATINRGAGAPIVQKLSSKALAQPVVNASFAAYEVIIAAARRLRTPTAVVPVLYAAGGVTIPVELSGLHTDSVSAQIGTQLSWFVTDKAGRLLRAGVPAQKLTVTRVDGIGVSKLGFHSDYSAPAGAPYTAEPVTVPTTFGHTLGGTLTKPVSASGKMPVVISITGSGAQDRDEYISLVPKGYRLFRQIADTLGRRGIAMLRMDDRGYGESGGSFAAATSRDFGNDIRAAIAYLRTRNDVDARHIFLAGHSEGGLVAPMVAVDESQLAGIVLMAGPSRTGREILLFQVRYGIEHDTSMTPARRDSALARVPTQVDSALNSSAWLKFFGAYDPVATAKRVKVPVLILQGGDDQQVIVSEATPLAAAFRVAGNRDVTMRVFPELNHLFIHQPGGNPSGYASLPSNLVAPEVLGALADWVAAHAAVMKEHGTASPR